MTEQINSKDVVKPSSVDAYIPTKFQIFIHALPELLRVLCAIGAIVAVLYFCGVIVFSKEPETQQFKQAAFTALIGIGTGAIGYVFGSSKKQS